MGQSQSDICYNKCFLFKASLWEFFIKNKIKNLLGPLKMCLCDLVLNHIVLWCLCAAVLPSLSFQCCSAVVLWNCSALVLLCYCAAVLSAMVLQCYDIVLL